MLMQLILQIHSSNRLHYSDMPVIMFLAMLTEELKV